MDSGSKYLEKVWPRARIEVAASLPVRWLVVDRPECKRCDEEKAQKLQSGGDSISDEVSHPLEDTAGDHDALNDSTKAFFCEDHVGGGSGGVSCPSNGNAHISTLEGRGIVHTVSRHAGFVAQFSEALHDQKLVFRKHLGEKKQDGRKWRVGELGWVWSWCGVAWS